jgi:hypothetical protein
MSKRVTLILAAVAAFAAIAGGAIAIAGGSDSEGGVTGPGADRATKAALEATGGGTANAVERDNENGATWEVEVTKTDGDTVDVRLDENYEVVVIEGDSESPDTDDGSE